MNFSIIIPFYLVYMHYIILPKYNSFYFILLPHLYLKLLFHLNIRYLSYNCLKSLNPTLFYYKNIFYIL